MRKKGTFRQINENLMKLVTNRWDELPYPTVASLNKGTNHWTSNKSN